MDLKKLESAIEQFYKTYPAARSEGRLTRTEEFKEIPAELLKTIPISTFRYP